MLAGIPDAFIGFMALIAALAGGHLALSPASPVEIFVSQVSEALASPLSPPARPATGVRPVRKRVYVTRP